MIPHDKSLHALAGAVVFSVVYSLMWFQALPALEIAVGAVFLAAVGKEVYDYLNRERHTPDPMDAVATMAGGAIPALPIIVQLWGASL